MTELNAKLNGHIKGLLIYPPNQLMDVETPRPDGSLGPLYLASSLQRHGIQTDILDASVGGPDNSLRNTFYRSVRQDNGLIKIGMNFDEIADFVSRGNYDFVGISSNLTPQTRMAFETARAIKNANPEVKIYSGGTNARALRKRFLETGYFDGICLTEGELIFPRMVHAHFSGNSLHIVPGVAFNDNGMMITNRVSSSCFPDTLDDLPMPAWEKLPLEKYEEIASPHGVDVTERGSRRYAPIMTSRGCLFMCSYCHISEEKKDNDFTGAIGKLRCHSIDRVVEEIDVLKALGVERLFFEDDTLLAQKDRVKAIFKRIKDKGVSISNVNGVNLIDFYNRGQIDEHGQWTIDIEYLEVLKDAGFDQMVFPVESASRRILKIYAANKVVLDRMNLPLLMRTMTDIGVKAPVNMMIGFPDETEDEIMESVVLAKKLMDAGAPYVTFFIPIPFPGSRLYDMAIQEGYLDESFNPDIMNWKHPVMKNTTIPPKKLEEIRDEANKSINTKKHLETRLKQSARHRLASITA